MSTEDGMVLSRAERQFRSDFRSVVHWVLTGLALASVGGALLLAPVAALAAWIVGTATVWALFMGLHHGLEVLSHTVTVPLEEASEVDRSGFC